MYLSLGDFTKAIEYHNLFLEITKEIGDRHGEGESYGSLANDYLALGDLMKAIDFCSRQLNIAKEVGDIRGSSLLFISFHFRISGPTAKSR